MKHISFSVHISDIINSIVAWGLKLIKIYNIESVKDILFLNSYFIKFVQNNQIK